ncbi:pyridine nucleotide-disulfide oxidoreductase/dicluster-binding protein [Anaerovorax odorimutans]|uniref:pyridine nucleotide-disulfide oxidoreductase/dicluster-binding protein n=1 Tax=Anaerovorax odorimutans TaxID=109327 RepID=UPI0004212950|nr:pyridine nucleotide-disulfide oxidoreductase/dicluster-binding protein [Anaerovorax odorimutans]
MEQYIKDFKRCMQNEIPFCSAECPFHIDILDFIEKMKRGDFKAAYKTYRNAVGFPLIASTLCHEPCRQVCPKRNIDSAIDLLKLEKASILFAKDKSATVYNLPMKKKKIAVIGAGISGLACALRLCMKKYEVEIFESKDRVGGSLWDLMPSDIFLKDINEQFKHEKYTLHLNKYIKSAKELEDRNFDAVYAATGKNGEGFGLLNIDSENGDKYCRQFGKTGWFAGGELIGEKPIYALAGGLFMGTVIDNFLKTGNLLYPSNEQSTEMYLNPAKLKYEEPVIAENGINFNEAEAKQEAERCIECQCDSCRIYCDLTDFYNKWPLRIKDEIIATTLPGSAEVKATPAKRLLSTCNQCGLCKEVCPENIDLGGLILEGRKSMHAQKKAAWVFHDFWLRDMEFSNSGVASLSKAPKNAMIDEKEGIAKCSYAFFPGCQLGASDPQLVEKSYSYLLSKKSDTGLILRCCGVPAEWSGDEKKYKGELLEIRRLWEKFGKPTLILACPTCEKKFKTYMKDIPVISLYEIIEDWGLDSNNSVDMVELTDKKYSVFDACAARHEDGMKGAVRKLADTAGYKLESLPENEALPRCCSYGGQPAIANPKYSEFVVQKRISESDNTYITYCINCRDVFIDAGKDAIHILDIIFGEGRIIKNLPTVSERRDNRINLKKTLLKNHWDEEMKESKKKYNFKLQISSILLKKLSNNRILEEDIMNVIEFCEHTGRKIYNTDNKTYIGYHQEGYMTYWVEYKKISEIEFELINSYSHRMSIELENVWNGKKIDTL